MIQDTKEKRTVVDSDESYAKVFICLGRDAVGHHLRKCLICERVFLRQESFEHSKVPCHPSASTAN
jgi:hypothetical protein